MDFAFFERLSPADARNFLASYLREGAAHAADLQVLAGSDLPWDHSPRSLAAVLEAVAQAAVFVLVADVDTEPDWVRRSPSWGEGPTELDEPSRVLVLRLSYHLGETARQVFGASVRWNIGDPESAEQQQPVLDGFVNGVQFSALLIAENLVRRVAGAPGSAEREIERTLMAWTGLVRP